MKRQRSRVPGPPALIRSGVLAGVLLAMTACTSDGSRPIPSSTGSADRPTVVLPTAPAAQTPTPTPTLTTEPIRSTEPTRTRDSRPSEPDAGTETVTEPTTVTESATVTEPSTVTAPTTVTESVTVTQSATVTEATTRTETTTAVHSSTTPSAPATSLPQDADTESLAQPTTAGPPAWLWWLLAALAIAVVTAVVLLAGVRRRRRKWADDLARATEEIAWFARDLIPQLQQEHSLAGMHGGWQVARPRITAVEDTLTGLPAAAPGEADAARAASLRDTVRAARERLDAILQPDLPAPSGPDQARTELAAAATALQSVLDPDIDGPTRGT